MSINQSIALGLLLVGVVVTLSAPSHAQCGELNWVEAINQALDANQALVAARQTLDAQQKDIAKARSKMLPSIKFSGLGWASEAETFSSSLGLIPARGALGFGQLNETLYNHADIDALGSQKHLYQSQAESYENARTQTIAAAGQGYLGVLLAQALMALQRENLGLTKKSLGIAQAQKSSGEVPYRNVLRWESQVYADERQVVAQKSSLLQSRFRFNQVRNRPAEEVCMLEQLTVEKDGFIFSSNVIVDAISEDAKAAVARNYLVNLGFERSHVLRSLDAEIEAQERTMKSARRWMIPSLDAMTLGSVFARTSGAGSDVKESGALFWIAGLTLDWKVLQGGSFIAQMNQSKAELWSLKSQRNDIATSLEENIRGTVAVAMASFEEIGLSVQQAETAAKNYELTAEAYLVGEAALVDLLDAQQLLLGANTAAREALYMFLSDLLTVEQSIDYFPFLEGDAGSRVRELEAKLQES